LVLAQELVVVWEVEQVFDLLVVQKIGSLKC